MEDIGVLIVGFFDFYGFRLDYFNEALSVRRGGVISKPPTWGVIPKGRSRGRRKFLLGLEDPQEPGRDIGKKKKKKRKKKEKRKNMEEDEETVFYHSILLPYIYTYINT